MIRDEIVVRNRLVRWVRLWAIAAAVAGILTLVANNARFGPLGVLETPSHHFQFGLLIASCVLLVWGLSDRPLRLWRWRDLSRSRRWELLLIAALTLFALALRLHVLMPSSFLYN